MAAWAPPCILSHPGAIPAAAAAKRGHSPPGSYALPHGRDTEPENTCPACGGAGGGPFGRAGSAWDVEDFVCPRCEGRGVLTAPNEDGRSERPGIAKTVPPVAAKKIKRADAG